MRKGNAETIAFMRKHCILKGRKVKHLKSVGFRPMPVR